MRIELREILEVLTICILWRIEGRLLSNRNNDRGGWFPVTS